MEDVSVLTDEFESLPKDLVCTSAPEPVPQKKEPLTDEERARQVFKKKYQVDKPGQGVTTSGKIVAAIRSHNDVQNLNELQIIDCSQVKIAFGDAKHNKAVKHLVLKSGADLKEVLKSKHIDIERDIGLLGGRCAIPVKVALDKLYFE
jgi:hypothetical protein